MDRDRKKVKMEKEEDEEEKMEKMYTFLKNAREMRKYVISSIEKTRQEEERARVCRFPSFQPEDFVFMNGAEAKNKEKAADISSSASNEYGSKEQQDGSETDVCLDLNLSL
ncbi:PREDICTED: LOW QUALITY PROTEIN: protein NIM1-INTERACTING 3-like [Camelina sativa]|uniref:LOW QUALITY PROTEIN: protein NIM1-INTERACTING 3-like n=1 Tax=Camelina sativa TaxID=90675 RepID=A0ABM1RIS2_CAMSA|nr:PREDICTED: LOW QUALITY PROTEIN: protein NIM1-INTERACTING 3-like [Camelina sativa]